MKTNNSIKSFFRKTAGIPVTSIAAADFMPQDLKNAFEATALESKAKAKAERRQALLKNIVSVLLCITKQLSKIFMGAILFVVLAAIAPELREQLPSLYKLVDVMLAFLEEIANFVCQIFDKILAIL